MTLSASPEDVPEELVALTRQLGDPSADLVVLAEGNTATALPGGRLAVKVSGAGMRSAGVDDFVVGDLGPLVEVLTDPSTNQTQLTAALSAGSTSDGRPLRASIETLVHVAAYARGVAIWSGHTHPVAVLGLLSTAEAQEIWERPIFPDEAVVCGHPLFVPYAEPGIALGRLVLDGISRYLDDEGVAPRLVLLANHGILALGSTAAEVAAVTTMCVKAARVRAIALSSGTLVPLEADHARMLADRPDEVERRQRLRRASA